MDTPTTVGNISVGIVAAALLKSGRAVLLPFGEGLRYDLAFDEGGTLQRVQAKTAQLIKGVISFKVCSQRNSSAPRLHYRGQVEHFGVYCPQTDQTFLVPINVINSVTVASLRVEAPKNGQAKGILWAKDFLL